MDNETENILETGTATLPLCSNCEHPVIEYSRFCRHCGAEQKIAGDDQPIEKWNAIRQLFLFFIIDAVVCCLGSYVHFFYTLSWSIAIDVSLAVIAVTFFALNWTRYKSVLVWHNFSVSRLLGYCVLAVAASALVSFSVDWFNRTLSTKQYSYYAFYEPYKHGKELLIFFTAVMPALFEELGYRGFALGKLLVITEKKAAIFISAFLFGIMHTSFTSLIWLIPFALWLGYVRIKQNTIWYGVCIHFCFNFTVCVTEIWQAGSHR
jgi:membrane protease YdiL (CAAX protease family)